MSKRVEMKMGHSQPLFDAEVETWGGLYDAGPGRRNRYAIFQGHAQKRTVRRMELCLELLSPKHGSKILDVGCGTGALGRKVAETGAFWVGLDTSLKMLLHGRSESVDSTFHETGWVNASAFRLPFKSESFGGIACLGVLNFYRLDMIGGILQEMYRVLKPGGTLVLTSLRLDVLTWVRSRLYPALRPPFACPGPIYPIHYRKLLGPISEARLECVNLVHVRKYFNLPHYTMFKLTRT